MIDDLSERGPETLAEQESRESRDPFRFSSLSFSLNLHPAHCEEREYKKKKYIDMLIPGK